MTNMQEYTAIDLSKLNREAQNQELTETEQYFRECEVTANLEFLYLLPIISTVLQ